MRKLILGIAIVLFMIQSAIATTTNFGPTDAVSIQNANGNWQNKLDPLLVVHATGSAIFVGSFTIDSKTFLKFDLTSISADATIDDAQLTLSDSIAAGNGGADVTISLFDNNNWDQSTKNFPTGNSKLLSNKVVTNTGTYTWDVKQGISKKNGRYSFNNLPIGNYKIITNRNVITVDLNEDKVINFGLKH